MNVAIGYNHNHKSLIGPLEAQKWFFTELLNFSTCAHLAKGYLNNQLLLFVLPLAYIGTGLAVSQP